MAKRSVGVCRDSRDAQTVLGGQVKQARLARGRTQASLAERIGVDARTRATVENGSPNVAIRTAFTAAFTAGVNLFGLEGHELALARRDGEEVLALLPKQARAHRPHTSPPEQNADDEF